MNSSLNSDRLRAVFFLKMMSRNIPEHHFFIGISFPITCAKAGWYKNGNEKVAGPFAPESKLFQGANWIANTTRGTNDNIHCSHLIYLYDQHVNPVVTRWLENSMGAFDNAYAFTALIQWVWRSRVRRRESIALYLSSPRMWELFEDWLSN